MVCHKPSYVPDHPYLYPIEAGAALAGQPFSGMLRDDTGDNISAENQFYCELTPQYWAWKNDRADYYGFFHYRRYLAFREVYPVRADGSKAGSPYACPYVECNHNHEDLKQFGFEPARMRRVIQSYDLITVLRERINTSVYRQYSQFHDKSDLDLVIRILLKKHPEYCAAAREYLGSHDVYYMNMYVMSRKMFFAYMTWLFEILDAYRKTKGNSAECLKPRIFGFLAERLFGIFYTYQREHGARCAEVRYVRFYNTSRENWEKTEELYREFKLRPLPVSLKINMRTLNRAFPAGSRRRLFLRSLIFH